MFFGEDGKPATTLGNLFGSNILQMVNSDGKIAANLEVAKDGTVKLYLRDPDGNIKEL